MPGLLPAYYITQVSNKPNSVFGNHLSGPKITLWFLRTTFSLRQIRRLSKCLFLHPIRI